MNVGICNASLMEVANLGLLVRIFESSGLFVCRILCENNVSRKGVPLAPGQTPPTKRKRRLT